MEPTPSPPLQEFESRKFRFTLDQKAVRPYLGVKKLGGHGVQEARMGKKLRRQIKTSEDFIATLPLHRPAYHAFTRKGGGVSGKSERQGLERRDMRQFCDNFHSSQSSSRFSRILNCRRRGRLCMQAYIRGDRRLKYG